MSDDQKAAPTWRRTALGGVELREVNWTEIYAHRDEREATLTVITPGRPPMNWTLPSEAADILSAQLAPRCLLVVDTPSRAAMAQRLMPGWMVTHLCGALTGHHFPLIVVAAQPVRECDRAWLSEFLPTKLDVGGAILFTEAPGQRTRGEVPSFSPAVQAMTGKAWFGEALEHLGRAAALFRENGVRPGAVIAVQGATLTVER